MEKEEFIKAATELDFSEDEIDYFVREGAPLLWDALIRDFTNAGNYAFPPKPYPLHGDDELDYS